MKQERQPARSKIMTVIKELNRLNVKATTASMVLVSGRVIESSENAFMTKNKDRYYVVYLKNGRVDSDIFKNREDAMIRMLINA